MMARTEPRLVPLTGTWLLVGGKCLNVDSKLWVPRAICLRLFWHWVRLAASRTFCTAGTRRAMRMAMIAITTKSSIKVNPNRRRERRMVECSNNNGKRVKNELGQMIREIGASSNVFSRRDSSFPIDEDRMNTG